MYLDENYNQTAYITISNPEEAFIDILDEFPLLVEKDLDYVDCTIKDMFPTSISLSLEGNKFDIVEAIGQIIEILISLDITNFNFTSHTVEHLEG